MSSAHSGVCVEAHLAPHAAKADAHGQGTRPPARACAPLRRVRQRITSLHREHRHDEGGMHGGVRHNRVYRC